MWLNPNTYKYIAVKSTGMDNYDEPLFTDDPLKTRSAKRMIIIAVHETINHN